MSPYIQGTISRNRDILADPDQQRVVVAVGTFSMVKMD